MSLLGRFSWLAMLGSDLRRFPGYEADRDNERTRSPVDRRRCGVENCNPYIRSDRCLAVGDVLPCCKKVKRHRCRGKFLQSLGPVKTHRPSGDRIEFRTEHVTSAKRGHQRSICAPCGRKAAGAKCCSVFSRASAAERVWDPAGRSIRLRTTRDGRCGRESIAVTPKGPGERAYKVGFQTL